MYTFPHLISSLILSAIIYPFFGLNAFFVLIGGLFIDLDHYILFLFKEKSFNIHKAWSYFRNKNICDELVVNDVFLFHTLEILILLIILSFYSNIFFIITLGMILHFILDFVYELKTYNITKISFLISKIYKKHFSN